MLVVLHAVNRRTTARPAGTENFKGVTLLLTGIGTVAAIIIGATAGTQDVANGVFRDLVVTGRKRSTLFNVRAPGALLVFLPMLAIGFAIAVVVAFVFAGSLPTPSASSIVKYVEYALAISAVNIVIAVGLAAFASSRVVVGVLIAWNAIVSHILISIERARRSPEADRRGRGGALPAARQRQRRDRDVDGDRSARAARLGRDLPVGRPLVDEPRRRVARSHSRDIRRVPMRQSRGQTPAMAERDRRPRTKRRCGRAPDPAPAPSDSAPGQTPAVARSALSPRAYPSPR